MGYSDDFNGYGDAYSVVLCRCSDDGGTGNDDDVHCRPHVDSEVYDPATCSVMIREPKKKWKEWLSKRGQKRKKERESGCTARLMAPGAVLGVTEAL